MTIEYENTLRLLIITKLGDDDNAPYKVSDERISKWIEKREIELKKYKGILTENRIIYYSDFYDLKTIIFKNWEIFLPILKNKKRFEIFHNEIENFRNSVAHGRNLTLSQEYLLKGITSDLKNQITIYHNKNEMKDDFFIEIIRVTDNLGNTWNRSMPKPIPILRAGDNYELTIEANDPKDRKILYRLDSHLKIDMTQESNRFNFEITIDMVGKNVYILVMAETPESEYKNEDCMEINFTILPK
ncbi:hypothetical protein SAMN05444274_1382 [Mariniphaga anaerophila]|uniref:Swt1-like HEPN domain-containing protein n=1 Tax=Mariniphaga anaerophila TaxID=1484053 RepID=A0A1M5GWD7_9BACT|nr:hypothetical protein [Mariniphaga anaerophila]SHG07742.1 hypothetical protein SAMN05444274_1382 [Mariniphaga anaerophila]